MNLGGSGSAPRPGVAETSGCGHDPLATRRRITVPPMGRVKERIGDFTLGSVAVVVLVGGAVLLLGILLGVVAFIAMWLGLWDPVDYNQL